MKNGHPSKILSYFILILLSISMVSAATYPAALNNGENFTTISQFQDIYQKIYQDSLTVDEPEVIRRTCEHEAIDCTYVPESTTQSMADFLNYFRTQSRSLRQYNETQDLIRNTLRFETKHLQEQTHQARSNHLISMLSNTDNGSQDGPFDIMAQQLETFEKIFIGQRAEVFRASFFVTATEIELNPEPENWQTQRTNADFGSKDFRQSEMESVGGLTDNLATYLVDVASQVGAANYVAKNLWDKWFSTTALGYSMCPGLDMSVDQPNTDTDYSQTRDQRTAQDILASNQGFLESYSLQTGCEITDSGNQNNFDNQQIIQACEVQRQIKLQEQIHQFQTEQQTRKLQDEYQTTKYMLDYLESFFATIRDMQAKLIELFQCYLQHPAQ